ncbi:MAG: peroxiredoxin [Bacteroidota bacterium]
MAGRLVITTLFLLILISSSGVAQNAPLLQVGDRAPDFSLPYATQDSIARTPLHLASYLGKSNIVLAFYPADWSGGCTKEVCTMRDDFGNIQNLNADILAISGDYVYSHHEWAKHHNLPFKLLSDHSHEVAKAYHSYNEKSLMNKRTVIVIDTRGTIAYMDLEYSVRDDADFKQLKSALSKLR